MKLSQLKVGKVYKVKIKRDYCSAGGLPSMAYPINQVISITIGDKGEGANSKWFRALYNNNKRFDQGRWWFAPEDFIWLNENKSKAPKWL